MVESDCSVKVRWSEADPAGIVFYPRFFEWFDLATEALFESVGLPWPVVFPKYRVVGVSILSRGVHAARVSGRGGSRAAGSRVYWQRAWV